ncbi:MAG: hypothetical protein A2268_13270 [Candidatus Raymondbacteria bacterium RifOxyA12_full_50_37]|uniref:Glycosyl transferase family 1 domain-containing protein n=1 Tax=Candidatus Raymondbacteria bacterium RIFOXYD12_FULL_49_13 TaxID=1817890 RepID=A0A1F7F0A6_UNCRA|nr:MAG: hypothetical protein A2268_13270 [Candidatus Raymondbacteria bacterium RifOxyA12_full_50_37]OGJ93032.1 MAG: hypothetical protein A2248_18405 [Candidatus Raymondbacteria bacterium RIFOXYA2_FULL_49_16]OGJ94865.1 MAG: hypothetical protein A2350_15460 [Candidatus Raymondbacteria bacterium RifOxyB12_full_50_8]OGJ99945.1 MAG: hypothetical protein A2519_00385 [Candidatus Raymondbacteria bacterium RIFOXYD12_FULL_49_13]OGK04136.1 MAG: hypothetical protein A2487_14065 [Candidatus Raymondbacteria 
MIDNNIVVLACLPSYEKYRDRYEMFVHLCDRIVCVKILLLNGDHPKEISRPNLLKLLFNPKKNIFQRRDQVYSFIKDDIIKGNKVIIHDTFLMQLGFSFRDACSRLINVRKVLSLYAPNLSFFIRYITKSKYSQIPIRLSEYPYYLKRFLTVYVPEALSCRFADLIIGNGETVTQDVIKYYHIKPDKTVLIPSEVNTDFFCPGDTERQKLGFSNRDILILFAGSFQRRKGVETLLLSFNAFYSEHSNSKLIMVGRVGDTGYRWFESIICSLPCRSNILFMDSVDPYGIRQLYRSVDMFVLPTFIEGSPRVVKEALACGCPVISSKIPGNYAIDPLGKGIYYADNWEKDSYLKQMLMVESLPELRQQKIEYGIALVKELHPRLVSEKYLSVYKQLFN